jgi:hypothetical protein
MLAGTGRRRRAYAGARWPYMRISVASHYYYEEYMILLRREFNLRNTVRRQTVPVRRAAGAARSCVHRTSHHNTATTHARPRTYSSSMLPLTFLRQYKNASYILLSVVIALLRFARIYSMLVFTGGPSWGPNRAAARSPQDKNSVFGLLNLRFIYKYRPILIERPGLVGLSRPASARVGTRA